MSKLPRRPIDPLTPPPGSFDQVVSTARARRRRRGMVVSSSAAVLAIVASAAFALGSSMDVRVRFISPAEHSGNTATNNVSTDASRTPSTKGSKAPGTKGAVAPITTKAGPSYLRGRAVDPEGNPISGLYVQPGAVGQATYDSDGYVAARTDANGYFKIGCSHSPVLLSTWLVDRALDSQATGGAWAATYVGGSYGSPVVAACGTTVHKVVLYPGATITGTVHASSSCSDEDTFALWVWLDGARASTVRLSGLHEGDTFTFSGLPVGDHILGARGATTSLEVHSGGMVTHDATFTCNDGSSSGGSTGTESPGDPSGTPDPDPTLEPTPKPTPSSSASASGWQSDSPSGSPSGQPASPSMSLSAAE